MRIGFAGAGNMAAAIARGWAAAGAEGPTAMLFCDLDAGRADALAAEVGGETRSSLPELRDDSDVLLLAVKPGALDAVAAELDGEAPPLVSVLALTPLDRLEAAFRGVPVLRVMPNQPVEVRRGVICHPPARAMDARLETQLLALLDLLGERSPAYVALFAEALAAGGAREGLDEAVALPLAVAAVGGTAELLRRRDPAMVRSTVASPGGATEAGLQALDRGGFGAALEAAVTASLERFR